MSRILDIVERVVIVAVLLIAAVYAGDFLWLHYRMLKPTPNDPFDVMTVQKEYQILQKDGRYEFVLGDPQQQSCVHALFPHAGYTTCWYLKRQNNAAITMAIVPLLPSH
jgi:hypothetical protein